MSLYNQELHLGWSLNRQGLPYPLSPVTLLESGTRFHTAMLAQSGSGKSFALGRFIEELALKTASRVLILDPNSDFIRISEIEQAAWEGDLKEWMASENTPEEFQREWGKIPVHVASNWRKDAISLHSLAAEVSPIALSWEALDLADKALFLGISRDRDLAEAYALRVAVEELNSQYGRDMAGGLVHFVDYLEDTCIPSGYRPGVSERAEEYGHLLYERARRLLQLHIWLTSPGAIVTETARNMVTKGNPRILVTDLGSLPSAEERSNVLCALLKTLMHEAREQKQAAIGAATDNRKALFIVIDEAHNIAPPQTSSTRVARVVDLLVEIASEGRKYGLFLVVASQRPSAVHPAILSQCDNLFLLRVSSRNDIEAVANSFGYLPIEDARAAASFRVGDALLAGRFVSSPTFAHIAPRRTAEGGRNLPSST